MSHLRLVPLVLLVCSCDETPAMDTTRTLIILHTNDEHSHLLGAGPEVDDFPIPTMAGTGVIKGGIARRAVILKRERDAAKTAGADTLTVSGGDNSQGTLMQVPFTTSAPDYTLMHQIGYDVSTLGNHEFDLGPKLLAAQIQATSAGGKLHTVATNIQFSATDAGDDDLAALFDESGTDMSKPLHRTLLVTTPNGLKVGFIGILGPLAATYAPLKGPVTFSLPAGAKESEIDKVRTQMHTDLQKAVDKLRNEQKADVVIALSHSGVDLKDMTKGEDYLTAISVTGIDAIAVGHTHTRFPATIVTNPVSKKPVMLQEAASYGTALGKMVIKVDADGVVSFDKDASRLIDVDDTIVAGDTTINTAIENVIKDLESRKVAGGKSFLEQTLSAIEGATVTDDPAKVGDLFFRQIGKAPFDMNGQKSFVETPVAVLIADADLALADTIAPTDVSVIASGVIRANVDKGKTGNFSFADVFRILPLGISPVDGTVGYPMTRFAVFPVELKAALEIMAGYAYQSEDTATYYLITGGLKAEYDTNRPAAALDDASKFLDPMYGRVTRITFASNHAMPDMFDKVVFNINAGCAPCGWQPPVTGVGFGAEKFNVVTSYYIANYAKVNGITLKKPDEAPGVITALTPEQAIIKRGDGSEIKEWEALAAYVRSFPSGGTLPMRYDASVAGNFPRRMICTGPACVK